MLSANISDDELLPSSESSNPRKSIRSTNQQNSNTVLKAYQVNAYKYINGKYENKGKLGLALLGSKSNNNYNVLLYGKGSTPVAQANINNDFNTHTTKELYVSFYDFKNDNWSIIFESNESFKDFLSRICVYKFLTSKNEYVTLDCKSGEGQSCNDGDLCELEVFVCTIVNAEVVSTIYSTLENDSKIIRIKLGTNKLLPIVDKCTIGMNKGGCRIIAISSKSNFIKTSSMKIPSDTDLLIQIKLIRFKSKVEKPVNLPEFGDNDIPLPNIGFEKNEYDHGESKKSELISRMAKMGKPIMGLNPPENNFETVNPTKPISTHTMPYIQPGDMNTSYGNIASAQIMPYQSNSQIYSHFSPNVPVSTVHTVPVTTTTASTQSGELNILFTETRQNNTETRIALSKLQDKIDKILEKMDISANSASQRTLTRHMDADSVYDNIKRIIDENESLKSDCSQKNDTINTLNKKINELLKSNQQYLDDSHNILERKSVSYSSSVTEHQNKILELEEEKLKYIRNLSQKTSELSVLQMQNDSLNGEILKYKNQSIEYSEQLTKKVDEYNEINLKNSALLLELNNLKDMRKTDNDKQAEFEIFRQEFNDKESQYQHKIDELKKNISQLNDKLVNLRNEYDTEISEIREQHTQELNDVKQKLKMERQKLSSKSTDLDNEIETLNRNWEERFDEFRKSESNKAAKLSEKNSQLMIENSNLTRELLELKETVEYSKSNSISEMESLRNRNKQILSDYNDVQLKLTQLNDMEYKLTKLETENKQLLMELEQYHEIKNNYDLLKLNTVELTSQLATYKSKLEQIDNSHAVTSNSSAVEASDIGTIETTLRTIMNNIFKQIKDDFISDQMYSGHEALSKCMVIIRDSTMKILNKESPNNEDEDEYEDEDDDEEEEEEVSDENEDNTEELIDEEEVICNSPMIKAYDNNETNSFSKTLQITENNFKVKEEVEEPGLSVTNTTDDFSQKEDQPEIPIDEQKQQAATSDAIETIMAMGDKKESSVAFVKEINDQYVNEELTEQDENHDIALNSTEINKDNKEMANSPNAVETKEIFDTQPPQISESFTTGSSTICENQVTQPVPSITTTEPSNITADEEEEKHDQEPESQDQKRQTALFSEVTNDDEDDDYADGFFESLNKKQKVEKLKQPKPAVIVTAKNDSDNDDLSWLNS